MRLTFADAQRNVAEIANRELYTRDVIFELLAAYGRSASAITKLRNGLNNLAEDKEIDVLQRDVVYFKQVAKGSALSTIDSLDQDPLVVRYNPRYLIATDYDQLVAKDTKKGTTLDIKLRDIDRNVDFFYGWTGDEVTSEKTEAVADRRAADKMKDLYVEIEKINQEKLADSKSNFRHDLNVFFSRLLFCFFAEDTKVFSRDDPSLFTDSIKDYTQTDGSDLDEFLQTLFDALDADDRSTLVSPFSKFPYVNGTIFDTKKHSIAIPKFNAQARKLILDCGNQNWTEINPDIFGSMFQSIVDEEHRAANGMHYTSVPNIMKTIEPLFLDELREEFDKSYDNPKKLGQLWDRVSKIKIFDPACGSGNFLIITYKELRKIEHAIIERLYGDDHKRAMLAGKLESRIKLDNFYGIEIDDFAHEVAILSLYLAKHQMNIEFEKQFGKEIILIPLKDNAKIVHGNAARIDWSIVCPNVPHKASISKIAEQKALIDFDDDQPELKLEDETWDEIYLIGNPPYLGSRNQDKSQKEDMAEALSSIKNYKILDYIAIWFYKGAKYINGSTAKLAFVSTNSITQGDQVATFWPDVLDELEIGFAYSSFKWSNNARNSAGVTVIIIGLQPKSGGSKILINQGIAKRVNQINAYLAESSDIYVNRISKPINGLPKMTYGNYTGGCESLILEEEEKDRLIQQYPQASKLIRQLVGSAELIRGTRRYCLWISNEDLSLARSIPEISERIDTVAEVRMASKDPSMQKLASRPHQFRDFKTAEKHTLVVPIVFSERREYISGGILPSEIIVPNSAQAIYDAPDWVFGVISSLMHMVWVKALSGRMRTDIRYSSAILYNNFPMPSLTSSQKDDLVRTTRGILFARENHAEKTLAEMYDPNKMPEDLIEAHRQNDHMFDRLYRSKPYTTDEERLADLFALYEQMTAAEKEKKT